MIQYLNNIIEQDHRFIKKKVNSMLGFWSIDTAKRTISGIEAMHMIRKGQVDKIQSVSDEVRVINELLGVAV